MTPYLSQVTTCLHSFCFGKQFVLPFLVNQCGSVLFYFTLSSTGTLSSFSLKIILSHSHLYLDNYAELSVAVPLTNGLTFLFTSLAGQLLGEHPSSSRTYAGMLCVVLGVALCLVDRLP